MKLDKIFIISIIALLFFLVTSNSVMGESIPPVPTTLEGTVVGLSINHTWKSSEETSDIWHLISGEGENLWYGYNWTGVTWQVDSAILSGIPDLTSYAAAKSFQKDSEWYLVLGEWTGHVYFYKWSGSTWQADSSMRSGLTGDYGSYTKPEVFEIDDAWYCVIGEEMGALLGYKWSGSTWQSDSTILNGLPDDIGYNPVPTVFEKDDISYMLAGEQAGTFFAYNWTGTTWQVDNAIISGITTSKTQVTAEVFEKGNIWYLILGESTGCFLGYNWTGNTWQADSVINSSLSCVETSSIPTVFNMGANITDSYNVSVNDVWHNGSANTFYNDTYSYHDWQNVTVWGYNSSLTGSLSTNSITQNTQIPNNLITITNTSDWNDETGLNVYVDYDHTDADDDTPTFSCSRTDLFTDFDTSTGTGNWSSAEGIVSVDFGVSDGYGSTDNYTMSITVTSITPPDPLNIANTTNLLWINHTWEPGSGYVTDSYNITINDVWHNTTTNLFYNDTYNGHEWQNITVFAYNSTGNGVLSENSISQNTQLPNNPITITDTSNWEGGAGGTVSVDFDSTDIDSDSPTFSCNRTDLFTNFNTATGVGSWVSTLGTFQVDFGVSDGYGSTDNYTMTISSYNIPPHPLKLENTSEGFWINNTWITGSFNLDGWYVIGSKIELFENYGYKWTGSQWTDYSSILNGLEYIPDLNAMNVFQRNGVLYLSTSYDYDDEIARIRYWDGDQWIREDQTVIKGDEYIPDYEHMTIFNMSDTWYLFVGIKGFKWNGSAWLPDSAIENGLPDYINKGAPFTFEKDDVWCFILGNPIGTFTGYDWNGTGWVSNSSLVSGLGDIGSYSNGKAFNMDGTWYIITGNKDGETNGFRWTGSIWESYWQIGYEIPKKHVSTGYQPFEISGAENRTDSYNVSVNGVWDNGTTALHFNDTYSSHEWQNITIYAYNSSGLGILSTESITQNTQLPNKPVTITNTSDWEGDVDETIYVDYDYTDLDSDTPTFSCNRTSLFTDFDTTTGTGNWTAEGGFYSIEFTVSDDYGSTDTYIMSIEVAETPPDAINLTNTTGGLWINHTWESPVLVSETNFYLMSGDWGAVTGYKWSDSSWESDTDIISGIVPGITNPVSPEIFKIDDISYLILARTSIPASGNPPLGYNWTGSTWQSDTSLISAFTFGNGPASLATYEREGTWYTLYSHYISTHPDEGFLGYNWTGTTWQDDSSSISGLARSSFDQKPTVFEIESTWYCIFGDVEGGIYGYEWTGSSWSVNAGIISGLTGYGAEEIVTPDAFQMDGIDYLTVGHGTTLSGYNWTGTTWQSDSLIVNGIATHVEEVSYTTFEIVASGEYIANTDSYNISVNGVWHNGTTDLFFNDTYSPHGWQNITVYGYSSLADGTLSLNATSQNTQLSNNPITISNISASYSVNEGETFTLNGDYSDPDSDVAVFSDNSSNWTIDSATGEVSWVTTLTDSGTYYYRITVDDLYGSTDYVDFMLTVNESTEVLSTDPTDDFEMNIDDVQILSAILNINSTTVWYVDEVESHTDTDSSTPDYYFAPLTTGVFNITFISTDPVNGTSDTFTWLITVESDGEVVPTTVRVPRPIRPSQPGVGTTQFIEEQGFFGEDVIEVIHKLDVFDLIEKAVAGAGGIEEVKLPEGLIELEEKINYWLLLLIIFFLACTYIYYKY